MHQYNWAANNSKLQQAILSVTQKHKLDPLFLISEENIKADYIKRAGLLADVDLTDSVEADEETVDEVKPKKTKKTK